MNLIYQNQIINYLNIKFYQKTQTYYCYVYVCACVLIFFISICKFILVIKYSNWNIRLLWIHLSWTIIYLNFFKFQNYNLKSLKFLSSLINIKSFELLFFHVISDWEGMGCWYVTTMLITLKYSIAYFTSNLMIFIWITI